MKKILIALAIITLLFTTHQKSYSNYSIEYSTDGFLIEYQVENPLDTINGFNFAHPADNNISVELISINGKSIHKPLDSTMPISLNYLGLRRGIPISQISFNTYEISQDKPLQNISFKLKFNNEIVGNSTKLSIYEKAFFADIVNMEQLQQLKSSYITKKQPDLQKDPWFDYNTQYIKFMTRYEGVAKVSMKDILAIYPEWENQFSDYINMLHDGEEQAIYLVDTDKKITPDDVIYFYGSFPHGDTTYYDFYEAREAYFLYLDQNQTGQRLTLSNNTGSTSNEISSVLVNRYISEPFNMLIEDIYWIGDEWGTMYAWETIASMSDTKSRLFETHQFVLPANDGNNTISNLHYQSGLDSSYIPTYPFITPNIFNLNYYINEELLDSSNYKGHFRGHSSGQTNYISGINRYTLSIEEDATTGLLYIDRLNITGYEKPHAFNGKTAFQIKNLKESSNIAIPGFLNSPVGIDTLNQTILFPESNQGSFATAGAINNTKGLLSLTINHEQAYYDAHGILIGYYDNDSLYYQLFEYDDTKILDFMNLAKEKPLAISCNIQTNLSSSILNKIEELTTCDISNITANTAWSIIYDNNHYVFNQDDFSTSVDGFLANANGELQEAHFQLAAGKDYAFFFNDDSTVVTPRITAVNPSRLTYLEQQADVIILTHHKFLDAANSLAEYRRKQLNLSIKVIDIDDTYNEFNFGRQSPYPIKEFLNYAYYNWRAPQLQYVILLGDANLDHTMQLNSTVDNDYLPVYGIPFTDEWYAMLDNDGQMEFTIGRIPVNTANEANLYIDKLKAYDNAADAPWMKRFLMLSGGPDNNPDQRLSFKQTLEGLEYEVAKYPLRADTMIISKTNDAKAEERAAQIISEIDKGVMWITFLGHGAPNVFDMDGWNVEFLSNKNRYGILTTLACNTGHFAVPDMLQCRNESYMLAPDRGMIASFGSAWGSTVGPSKALVQTIFYALSDTTLKMRRLGDLTHYAKCKMNAGNDPNYASTSLLFHVLGDPLIKLRIADDTDLYIAKENVSIVSDKSNTTLIESDNKAIINGTIFNIGYSTDDSVDVRISTTYQNETQIINQKFSYIGFQQEFTQEIEIFGKAGIYSVTINIDPDNYIEESKKENNVLTFDFEVFKEGVLPVEPMPLWNISTTNPIIRFINPESKNPEKSFIYEFEIDEIINGTTNTIRKATEQEITVTENYVQWAPQIELTDEHTYIIKAKSTLQNNNSSSAWLTIPVIADISYKKNQTKLQYQDTPNLPYLQLTNITTSSTAEKFNLHIQDRVSSYDLISYHRDLDIVGRKNYCFFRLDDIVYLSSTGKRGFFMLDVPLDATKEIGTFRNFDTWGNVSDDPANHWWNDSPTEGIVRLLRDTIPEDTYVMTATCASAWRVPLAIKYNAPTDEDKQTLGALDTLRSAFREYGSAMIDSIDGEGTYFIWGSWKSQYQSIGKKGATPGSITENYNNTGDTLYLSGTITRYMMNGTIRTQNIGTATQWNKLTLKGIIGNNFTAIKTEIHGLKVDGTDDILFTTTNQSEMDLSAIDAKIYPTMYLVITFTRKNLDDETLLPENQVYISGIEVDYKPATELAIVQSKTKMTNNHIMRGEPFELQYTIENISPRVDLDDNDNDINIKLGTNSIIDTTIILNNIEAAQIHNYSLTGLTDYLESTTEAQISINPTKSYSEPYSLNNTDQINFNIDTDTIPPTIEVLFDGVPVKEADFVSKQPFIEVNIYDNSPLAITDSTYINVFVNGYHLPVDSTVEYEFISYERGSYQKVKINIIPSVLFYGNNPTLGANSIRIIAKDASGNENIYFLRVNVSQAIIFDQALTYPNPVIDDNTEIAFTLKSQLVETATDITIYDIIGNKVKTIAYQAHNGENRIPWDCTNEEGNRIAPGVYMFNITTTGEYWGEPMTGKMTVIR